MFAAAAKGKGLAEKFDEDAPWVEKYRPKTLDDVAAHSEIIDTSKFEASFLIFRVFHAYWARPITSSNRNTEICF